MIAEADDVLLRSAVAEFCRTPRSSEEIKRNFPSDPEAAMRVVHWMLCHGRLTHGIAGFRSRDPSRNA